MPCRRLIPVLLLASAALGATQAPSPPGPVEKVTIRLAQYDVVVRDGEGRLVEGLGKDDFAVFEDGRPMEIVAVDAWGFEAPKPPASPSPGSTAPPPVAVEPGTEPAAGTEVERRSFVLLFDALNGTSALRFTQAKRAAMAFVRQRMGPEDTAVVYSLDLALRAQSGFSSDREELARAIDKIPFMPGSSLADEVAESVLAYRSRAGYDVMDERLVSGANLEAERLDWTRQHFYQSVQGLQDVFQALPGKRILIVASAGFPMTTAGSQRRELGGFTPEFRELIRVLARAGVVAYTLDIGDDLAFSDPGKSIDWRIAVGKLGMDENVLDDLGLDAGMGSGSAGQRRQMLGVLAAETGGRLLTPSDLNRAFQAIDEESSTFYRISCRVPEREGDERYRKIAIRVQRAGLKTTARRGRYGDIVPDLRRGRGTAGAGAESLARFAPIGMRATASTLPADADGKVPVTVVAEVLGPVALRRDASGAASLDVDFFAVARAGGEVVSRYEKRFAVRVKPDGIAPLSRGFRLEGRLALPPGLYDVQTTVRVDDPPQFGSWSGQAPIQPQKGAPGPRVVSAWLAGDGAAESPLILRVDAVAGAPDPLVLGPGVRVLPASGRSFRPGEPLLAMVWLAGLQSSEEGTPPALSFDLRLRDPAGSMRAASGSVVAFEPVPGSRWRVAVRIDTIGLTAGAWAVELEAKQPVGDGVARVRLPFAIADEATSSAP